MCHENQRQVSAQQINFSPFWISDFIYDNPISFQTYVKPQKFK